MATSDENRILIQNCIDAVKKNSLDPIRWQALGKALGWPKPDRFNRYKVGWVYQWHLFIDHIASGKSADEFFKELVKESL